MLDFYKEHLSLNLEDYSNIGFNLHISRWLLVIFTLITIGAIINHYRKSCVLFLLNELLTKDAIGESNAVSTKHLNIKGLPLKFALSYKKLTRMLCVVKSSELPGNIYLEGEKKKKSNDMILYIKEKQILDAREMSESTCPTLGKSLLFLLLMISIYILVIFSLPELLILINNNLK